MTADALYLLMTGTGKPVTPQRLAKAKAKWPEVYDELLAKLQAEGKLPG